MAFQLVVNVYTESRKMNDIKFRCESTLRRSDGKWKYTILTVPFGSSATIASVVTWNFWYFALRPISNISTFSVENFGDLGWPVCTMWCTRGMRSLWSSRYVSACALFVCHSTWEFWSRDTTSWIPFPNWASPTMVQQLNAVPNCLSRMPSERATKSFEWFYQDPFHQPECHLICGRASLPTNRDQCAAQKKNRTNIFRLI